MKTLLSSLLLSALFISGCSTGPALTLRDIQPKRVFHLTRTEAFETARLFGLKEGFRIDSQEEETGRVVGHATLQARPSVEAGRLVVMNLRIHEVDSAHTEVTSRFTFSSVSDALTREEESILVDYYVNLYSYFEQKAQ
jgi:hypothetical protein